MPSNSDVLKARATSVLHEHFLPFWTDPKLYSKEDGFVGRMDGQNNIDPRGEQGVVYYSRLLWTYSALGRSNDKTLYEDLADRAYDYLQRFFFDDEHGGVYWLLDADGSPLDRHKRSYAQAFYLYALSEYYLYKGDEWVADDCRQQFNLIESNLGDPTHGGYLEVFSADWNFVEDGRLSPKEPIAAKSMNTHLHVLEAYSAFARIDQSVEVLSALKSVLELFLEHVVDKDSGHLLNTFDRDWSVISRPVSFGHDIEASWLLVEAAEILGDKFLTEKTRSLALRLVDQTLEKGVDEDGGLFNELEEDGNLDDDKHWWPQLEAAVGLVNAWQISGDGEYLRKALWIWDFIDTSIIDQVSGACFFRVSKDGVPYLEENKIGPWKGPYHSIRACLEIKSRLGAK